MTPQTPVLDIRNLSVRLPGTADRALAVDDVSFAIAPGEIVCVVGESGSGKSVISQAVMGLLPKALSVAGGSVRLKGEELLGSSRRRLRDLRGREMSMIFQEPMTALNPVMTVGRQITEVLSLHTDLSAQERRARALEIMDLVQLPDPVSLYDAYPHELSGGQRQRVMIASALILEPSLLIADEPTTALDVTTQAQILKLLRDIQRRRGTAIMFVTHDFGVVADIADRVVVMCRGELVETGPAEEVLRRPRHPYSQMLVSSVPGYAPGASRPVPPNDAVLSVDALSKTYRSRSFFGRRREVAAVKDVSFAINRGETVGLVGESGSGKSTLARCVARLLTPTDGRIELAGQDFAKIGGDLLRRQRRKIQIVFQDPYRSLNPRRPVGASIVECPLNYGWTRDDAWNRARELMTLVGLQPDALARYPHEFSGGQRQRICIARALAVRPEVLIADEALSALDVSIQAQVLELLRDIRQRFNLAIFFITHDLRVAAQLCDRILVMQRGVVVEQGETSSVLADPQHPYTRVLIDSAPGRGFAFYSSIGELGAAPAGGQ